MTTFDSTRGATPRLPGDDFNAPFEEAIAWARERKAMLPAEFYGARLQAVRAPSPRDLWSRHHANSRTASSTTAPRRHHSRAGGGCLNFLCACVIPGTSNQRALNEAMKAKVVTATVVPVKSREEGLAQLEAGTIDALASDRVLLVGLVAKAKDPKALALLADPLSYEPYAIMLPRGDWQMHHAVDAALAQIYRSAALPEIYHRWFGAMGRPNPILEVMFALGRLPE